MDASICDRSKALRRIEEPMMELLLCGLLGMKPQFVSALRGHLGRLQLVLVTTRWLLKRCRLAVKRENAAVSARFGI